MGEIGGAAHRIVPVEAHLAGPRIEEQSPQGALQQVDPEQRPVPGLRGIAPALELPLPLHGCDPLDHDRVVVPMRPAVQRQPHVNRRALAGGEQQPVATEIVESDPLEPQFAEHRAEAVAREQLERQEVMQLQAGIVTGNAGPVDLPERQRGSGESWLAGRGLRLG